MKKSSASRKHDRLFRTANAAWDRGDLKRAFGLFLQAAKAGDPSSQLDLGYFFDTGLYVERDKQKALHWYHKAYCQGDAGAANNIATVHRESGELGKMVWWFRRAAALGDDDAFFELGRCYEKGLGVAKNVAKARRLYGRVLASRNVVDNTREQAVNRLTNLEKLATKAEPGGCTGRRKSGSVGNSGPLARRQ
jgi:TPR repeat protein